jgi:hypothetical protein
MGISLGLEEGVAVEGASVGEEVEGAIEGIDE